MLCKRLCDFFFGMQVWLVIGINWLVEKESFFYYYSVFVVGGSTVLYCHVFVCVWILLLQVRLYSFLLGWKNFVV